MQPETHEMSTGAQRMRRYRQRKRQGVVGVARVPIYVLDVEALVTGNRLRPEHESNREKIAEAVEAVLDDFAEGRLASGNTSPQDKPEVGLGREK